MSNPLSQTPTNKKAPLTEEQKNDRRKWMAKTPCKHGENCERLKQGNCSFLHGGRVVTHDPRSHQQVQPPPPTEKDIIKKILSIEGFGEISLGMLNHVDDALKLDLFRVLLKGIESLRVLKTQNNSLSSESSLSDEFSSTVEEFINSFTPFVDKASTLENAFEALKKLLTNPDYETRKKAIETYLMMFALPEGMHEILRAFDSQTASYATAVNLSPLEVARRYPDGTPTPEFISFLKTIDGFSDYSAFIELRSTHSELGRRSTLTNRAFVGVYDAFKGLQEGSRLVEKQRALDNEREKHRMTVTQLVKEIQCFKATNLAVSFQIMTANRAVFDEFVSGLSEINKFILQTNFATFRSVYSAYMSMSLSKGGTISNDSLNRAFENFRGKFKLDHSYRNLDDVFFNFSRKEEFSFFWDLFNKKCPSPNHNGNCQIASSDVFKKFLKAIDGVFRKYVDVSEIQVFETELVKRGLVILLMVMMSPDVFSPLVSKGYTRTYKQMKSESYKSFLYYLTQTAYNTFSKHSSIPEDFAWSSLPNFFNRSTNGKQIFSIEYLFEAIDTTLSKFMSASNVGLNDVNVSAFLQENKLDWLFEFTEDEYGLYIKFKDNSLPIEVIQVLFGCYAVEETSEGARQVSHLKALLSLHPDLIQQMMKLLITIPSSENKEDSFEGLLSLLDLRIDSKNHKDLAFSGLNEFLIMLNESKHLDVYSEALFMMSVFSYIQKIHNKFKYFMNLPSAIIFVLMKNHFKSLTHCEIANLIYNVRHGHENGTVVLNQKIIMDAISELHDNSPMKEALGPFTITKSKEHIKTTATELSDCTEVVQKFKMLFEEHCPLLSEFLKRALPYYMNARYMAELFQNSGEQVEVSPSEQSLEDSLNERLKASFMMTLRQSISQMSRQIFFDLSKKFEDIVKESSVQSKQLNFYKFARHISTWINLVNSIFQSMGIELRVSFDQIMKDLPDTKSREMSSLEKAKLMTRHACKILNITVSENWDDFLQDDQNSVLFWVVYKTLIATYNTELPKREIQVEEKVIRTIPIHDLKTILETCSTLDKFFSTCLPYMESRLVREFLLPVLDSHFTNGNKQKLDSLLRLLENYDSKFTNEDKNGYDSLFEYIASPRDLTESSERDYENELFEQIKDSLSTDPDWTEANVVVAISEPIVKQVKSRFRITQKPQPQIDSGMSSGGGCAVDDEHEDDEHEDDEHEDEEQCVDASAEEHSLEEPVEASVIPSLNVSYLRSLLDKDERQSAIDYLKSVVYEKDNEIRTALIDMLSDEANNCDLVIQAINESEL
jgi:hypothetical protein